MISLVFKLNFCCLCVENSWHRSQHGLIVKSLETKDESGLGKKKGETIVRRASCGFKRVSPWGANPVCISSANHNSATKSGDTEHIVVPSVMQIASIARHANDLIPTRKWTQTDFCASTHHLGKQQQGVAVLELARVVRVLWRDVRTLRVTGLAPMLCQILLWVHNQLLHLSHSLQYL